jgi:hypothetical protein
MSREEVFEFFEVLAEDGVIVEDGTWAERYIDRILDPKQAAVAAVEAMGDDEVMVPHAIATTLAVIKCVPRAAVAAVLRTLWLEGGMFSDAPGLVAFVFKTALEASTILMTPAEHVTVFRGQLHGDLCNEATGMSWTLSEQVADWYAAPIPGETARGRVLSAIVPRSVLLALFLERGESEVVIDLGSLRGIQVRSRAGRCDKFPAHLQATKSWFF